MIEALNSSVIFCVTIRATASVPPPAGNGTMSLMVFVGKLVSAKPVVCCESKTENNKKAFVKQRDNFMVVEGEGFINPHYLIIFLSKDAHTSLVPMNFLTY